MLSEEQVREQYRMITRQVLQYLDRMAQAHSEVGPLALPWCGGVQNGCWRVFAVRAVVRFKAWRWFVVFGVVYGVVHGLVWCIIMVFCDVWCFVMYGVL